MNKTTIFIIAFLILSIGVYKLTGNTISNMQTKILMTTSLGNIEIELYPDKAPITVKNFLNYIDEGQYTDTVFHRVISGFMIQGGGFTISGQEKDTDTPIKLESDNGLENKKGTIAMARTNVRDSATSQFFINTVDNDFLNYAPGNDGYAVFGKVTKGMDIVEKIEASQTTTKKGMQNWPVEDVVIESVKRI